MNRLCAEPEIISNTQDVILLMRAAIMRGEFLTDVIWCLVSVNSALFLHLIVFSQICMVSLSNSPNNYHAWFSFSTGFHTSSLSFPSFPSRCPPFFLSSSSFPQCFLSFICLFSSPLSKFLFSPHLLLKLYFFLLYIPSATLLHSILPLFHPPYTLLHPSLSSSPTPSISRHPMVNLFIFFSLSLSLFLLRSP